MDCVLEHYQMHTRWYEYMKCDLMTRYRYKKKEPKHHEWKHTSSCQFNSIPCAHDLYRHFWLKTLIVVGVNLAPTLTINHNGGRTAFSTA